MSAQAWWRQKLDLGDLIAVTPFHSKISVTVAIGNQADSLAKIQQAVVDFEGGEKREARAWILPQSKNQPRDAVPIGRSKLIIDWKPSREDGPVSGLRVWIEGAEMPVSAEGIETARSEISARMSP